MSNPIEEEVQKEIKANKILIYGKGTKQAPMCGFTRETMQFFDKYGFPYELVDVLQNPAKREFLAKMTNWTTFDAGGSGSGARVTTWNYDAYRGWLSSKRYHDSTGPDYTYTDGGRLRQRSWVRVISSTNRVSTAYVYGFDNVSGTNSHGDLVGINYSNDPARAFP